eukprot:2500087-Amphidinium_carterae.1
MQTHKDSAKTQQPRRGFGAFAFAFACAAGQTHLKHASRSPQISMPFLATSLTGAREPVTDKCHCKRDYRCITANSYKTSIRTASTPFKPSSSTSFVNEARKLSSTMVVPTRFLSQEGSAPPKMV